MIAAAAQPKPVLGKRNSLFITDKPELTVTLENVQEMLREAGVAAFKIPEYLVILEELPRHQGGK